VTITVVYQQRHFPWLHYATCRAAGREGVTRGPLRFTQASASRSAERALIRAMRGGDHQERDR